MKTLLVSLRNLLLCGVCLSVGPQALTSKASAQNRPSRIEIVVVEGEGVVNDARKPVPRNLAVRVEDDDHVPVSGASVVFALPVTGASGAFVNGSTNLTVVTDASGLAEAHGLRTNQNPGKLEIYVTASYRGLRARRYITQFIEGAPGAPARQQPQARSRSGGKWKWVVLGVAAAGGAAGGIYYYNSQQRSSSNSAISVTAGSVVFGSPR